MVKVHVSSFTWSRGFHPFPFFVWIETGGPPVPKLDITVSVDLRPGMTDVELVRTLNTRWIAKVAEVFGRRTI